MIPKQKSWRSLLLSVLLVSVFLFMFMASPVLAVELPCTPSQGSASQNDVFNCVNSLYKYGLVIATIAAVFMIIIGGYLYIFSGGSESRVGTAKSFISTSLIGLAILIVGYLILQQINPEILNIKSISMGTVEYTPPLDSGSGGALTGGSGAIPRNTGPVGNGKAGDVVGKDGKTVCNGGKDVRGGTVNCSCYPGEVKAAAKEFGVDPALLFAVIQQESRCNPNAGSNKGARGLMQVIPQTAASIGCASNWATDPTENIRCGAKYLSKYIIPSQPGGASGLKYVLAAYNAGPGNNAQGASVDCPGMRRWECPFNNTSQTVCNSGAGSFEETRNYVVSAERYYNEAKAKCGN